MKSFKTILLFCLLTLGFSAFCVETQPADQHAMDLHLVFDATTVEEPIAKKFRINHALRASASGQFSADELPKILHTIPAQRRQDIWIVDLRQESHGFIDGLPVSWVADRNSANNGKSAAQIKSEELHLLQDLNGQKTVTVFDLKKLANGRVMAENPTTMIPELIETEQQLVTGLGAKYARIYVLDHNKPSDAEVDNFIEFIKYKIKAHDWLHFHCRGGAGRSSTFIVMYDMIRNAKNTEFNAILQRQVKMGSIKLNGMPTSKEKRWKIDGAYERYVFLGKFYNYVVAPQGYQVRSWSDWLRLREAK